MWKWPETQAVFAQCWLVSLTIATTKKCMKTFERCACIGILRASYHCQGSVNIYVIGCCGLQVVELVASDEGEVVQSLAEVNRCARVLQVCFNVCMLHDYA